MLGSVCVRLFYLAIRCYFWYDISLFVLLFINLDSCFHARHVFAKGPDYPVLASYQMWFCRKLLKNAKSNSQIVKFWWFLWNRQILTVWLLFWRFWAIFGKPHLVAHQNVTFSTLGRCMSVSCSVLSYFQVLYIRTTLCIREFWGVKKTL